jgi:hypothetical protein
MEKRGDRAAIRADVAAIAVVVVARKSLPMAQCRPRKSPIPQPLRLPNRKLLLLPLRERALQARSARVDYVSPAPKHSTSFVARLRHW